jgi:seryl-tRNA synthetase
MIDLKDLRTNPDKYRQGAADKGISIDIDALLATDTQLRQAMHDREQLTAEKNRIGKEIGQLAGRLKKASDDEKSALAGQLKQLQLRPTEIKAQEQQLQGQVQELEIQRDQQWMLIPQPADTDVPVGKSADENVPGEHWKPDWFDPEKSFADNKGFEPKSHIELGQDLGLMDFERGVKLSGARSYVLRGDGMMLHQAVVRLALDFMIYENGFTAMTAPPLVREHVLIGTGFFPHAKDDVYHIANPTSDDELYLTGTGEAGLTAIHAGEKLDPDQLPICYTTLSTCFRRESGSAGKDTRGLYRIHQFDKVEQVVLCKADEAESKHWHTKMLGFAQALVKKLELPYRLLQCCTGDLGPKNVDMIDVECWMPSRGENGSDGKPTGAYCETHSASRLYDYQCRRLNIRYQDPETKKNVFCHSLNNTVAASPRILIPILELYQNEDGTITIPPVLRPYMNGQEKIG